MLTHRVRGICLVLMLLLAAAGVAQAQDVYLEGSVYDTLTAAPIAGATVCLPESEFSTQTLSDGSYRLGPFPDDGWWRTFAASAPGYSGLVYYTFDGWPAAQPVQDWYLVPQGTAAPPHFWKGLPHDLALIATDAWDVDAEGQVYALYRSDFVGPRRVRVFGPDGTPLRDWPASTYSGPDYGAFRPDLAVASDGSVLVSDPASRLVQRFDDQGNLLNVIALPADWESGVLAVDGDTVYMEVMRLDLGETHLAAYTLSGTFLREWWVGSESTPGFPVVGLKVAPDHTLFLMGIPDVSPTVWHYTASGESLGVWGADEPLSATDFAIASDGNLYCAWFVLGSYPSVPNTGGVLVYSPQGVLLGSWGAPAGDPYPLAPLFIAADAQDRLRVLNVGCTSIDCFSLDGSLLARWGGGGTELDRFGSIQWLGYVGVSSQVAFASDGTAWVADPYNSRVKHLSATGSALSAFGIQAEGSAPLPARGPTDVAVAPAVDTPDPHDYWVCLLVYKYRQEPDDIYEDQYLQVFSPDGQFVREFRLNGDDRLEFRNLSADAEGRIWGVHDWGHVYCYSLAGELLSSWDIADWSCGVEGLTISPSGDVIIWGDAGYDSQVRRYGISGNLLDAFTIHDVAMAHEEYSLGRLAVAPDDSYYGLLWGGRGEWLLRVSADGEALDSLPLTEDPVWAHACSVAVSPTGVIWLGDVLNARMLTFYYGTFHDVPQWHWAKAEIEACVSASIVGGYADDSYRPGGQVTRDQMAVYISRTLAGGDELVPTGPAAPTFPDVPTDHWAYKYVEYCYDQGVVQGYWDGYHPDEVVNRAQMAVYIARALVAPAGDAGVPDPPEEPTFPDVTPTNSWAWCYRQVEFIAAEGVTQGYPEGAYRPAQTVTRDQMAVYVARAFELAM